LQRDAFPAKAPSMLFAATKLITRKPTRTSGAFSGARV